MLIFAPPFLSGRSLPVAEPATESRSVLALGKTGSPSHFPSVWPWMIHTVLLVCLGWQQSVCREESAVCQVKWEWVSVCWKRSSQHWFCSLSYCTSLVGRTKNQFRSIQMTCSSHQWTSLVHLSISATWFDMNMRLVNFRLMQWLQALVLQTTKGWILISSGWVELTDHLTQACNPSKAKTVFPKNE